MPHQFSHISDAAYLERYVVPSLRHACHIIKFLAQKPGEQNLTEIARTLRIPVTTTLRILTTLQLEGFVCKKDNRFALGPALNYFQGPTSLSSPG